MKCIVKGCENEAVKQMLCEEHYDPAKQVPDDNKGAGKHTPEKPSLGRPLALFAHTALLISGKLAGKLVRGYSSLFTLSGQERAQILDHVASADLKKGHKARSLSAFENAAKLDPDNPEVYRRLGEAYLAAEEYEKACTTFRKVLELDPECAEVSEALGEAYYHCEDYKSAEKYLAKAKSLSQDSEKATYLLGMTYDKLGKVDKAIKFLQAAIDMNPRNVKYYYTLGFVYEANQMKDQALENFKKAVELERSKTM